MIITRSSSVAEYKPEAVNALDGVLGVLVTPDCLADVARSLYAAFFFVAVTAATPADAFVGLALVPERGEVFLASLLPLIAYP